MGFVMRLNSRDLVNDPKNGAEVYPITATNAVYRAGTDKNLEQILSELSNSADRKVIQDLEYLSNTNTLQISYTDNTTDNIQLLNWVRNVAVTKNNRTYIITVTPTTGSASTYTIELPNVTTSGSGNGLSDISYDSSTNTITATKSNFLTDITCVSGSDINTVGTPSVTSSINGSTTTLTFHQLKGAKGDTGATGPQGPQGPAGQNGTNGTNGTNATITGASASVSEDGGSPSCTVTLGGTASARTFNFAFKNINGKDGQDADTNFNAVDITVSDESQFLNAIAYSHGYYYTKYNNTASHLTDDAATDISDGETKDTGSCLTRIHLAANIDLKNISTGYTVDLSHCEINGYSFDLNLWGKPLNIVGRSAKFNEIRFVCCSNQGTPRASGGSGFTMFTMRGITATHSKFRFTNCQFNKIFSGDTFISYICAKDNGTTYSTYIDGFETNDTDQNEFNVTDNYISGDFKDGNHNLIITRRYTTYAITVNMTAHTQMESRLLRDSSVTKGTLVGVTDKNIYS